MSAAVSSTSPKTADHRTSASWAAPTDVDDVSANTRSIGVARCGTSSGIRTSYPAFASHAPVVAIISQASSWLRITCPRRALARDSAGSIRSSRTIWSSRSLRPDPALTIARSIGTRDPLAAEANTSSFHASARSGGSSRTISGACSRVTERAQLRDSRHELRGNALRGLEGAPVEPGQERLGDVVRRTNARRWRGHLDPASAVTTDGVDNARERRAGQGPSVDARIECQQTARQVVHHLRQAARVEQCRRPANRERGTGAALGTVAPLALPQQRNHRSARGELDPPDGDAPQPSHARADVVADLTGSGRDQPSQDVTDRSSQRVSRDASRQRRSRRGESSPRSAHPWRRASP